MLKTPSDAIKIPASIACGLTDLGLNGHLNWVTPRLLAALAKKPFRLLRRGWRLSNKPFGYAVGGKTLGQFFQIDMERRQAVLHSHTADCWHRVVISLEGELLASGAAYADGRDVFAA